MKPNLTKMNGNKDDSKEKKPVLFISSRMRKYVATIVYFGYIAILVKYILNNYASSNMCTKRYDRIYKTSEINERNYALKHVHIVLQRLGFEYNQNSTNWDLFWSIFYPHSTLRDHFINLKSHQKVTIFPGSGALTVKVDLSTSSKSKYMPKAWKMPSNKEEFMKYAFENLDKKFLIKATTHRGVRLLKIDEIDEISNASFIQEFIDKPLLIDGYLFDIGIYTFITSIDPLRIYIYNGDFLMRFCPEKFHPLNATNRRQYVIELDYTPTWKIPPLTYYFEELGLSMKDTVTAYLKTVGIDSDIIFRQIYEALGNTVMEKAPAITNYVKSSYNRSNFFELMRFDFIVDETLNVYLIEANMSPNLYSAEYITNRIMYEQLLYNLFSLIGVADRIHKPLNERTEADIMMTRSYKHIATIIEECKSPECQNNCTSLVCKLCKPCMSDDLQGILLDAYREHMNRGDTRRIFPPPMKQFRNQLPENYNNYSLVNQLMIKWFMEKCNMDETWCI